MAMAQLPFCLPVSWFFRDDLSLITFLLPTLVPRTTPAAFLPICLCTVPQHPPVPTLAESLPGPLLHFTCLVQTLISAQMLTCSSLSWLEDLLIFHAVWEYIRQHLCSEKTIYNGFPFFVCFLTYFLLLVIYFNALLLCFEPWSNFYRMSNFFVCFLIEEISIPTSTGKDYMWF